MITIDVHEPRRIDIQLKKLGLNIERKPLNIGDYAFGEYRIERKEVKDFLNSVYSGRIYNQLYNLRQAERPILIIVGDIPPKVQWIHAGRKTFPRHLTYEEQMKRYKTIRENIITAYTSYNVQVFHALDDEDFCQYIASLYYKSTKKGTKLRKLKRKSRSIIDIKTDIFGCIPGIGISLASTLAKEKTVREIFNESEENLKKIPGIGEKTSKKIVEVVTS